MHEFSVVQALLSRVEEEARGRGATAVHRIEVRIGELSGVEPELLASAFDLAREHTLCRGAALAIQPVPARWVCPRCGRPLTAGSVLRCADCGAPARLDGGGEIVLERIEMEVA